MHKRVFVGNVHATCTESYLYEKFRKFGAIERIKIQRELFRGVQYPNYYNDNDEMISSL